MRAIDTNILVRLATGDDSKQHAVAAHILEEPFILLPTVIMEAVWVLQSSYGMDRASICERVGRLTGHPMAENVSGESVMWAFDRFGQGADFADMLHLALARDVDASRFSTFDKAVGKFRNPPIPVELMA